MAAACSLVKKLNMKEMRLWEANEGNETLGSKPRKISPYDYDFISYDFLKHMLPQPELFELRQVLAIPKEDVEARHEYMIYVIKERADDAEHLRKRILFKISPVWL
jgi:hypothetical protein